MRTAPILGIETHLASAASHTRWGVCGLICNQASTFGPAYRATATALKAQLGSRLRLLFTPQHGYFGTEQDNMIESAHGIHEETQLPIFSLYSQTRQPPEEALQGIDTLLFDLPVVGCRVYTYKYTLAECLRAAKKWGKRLVVFDRPNPVGGRYIEGPCLVATRFSFVGQFSLPMRHGLSMGEFARFCNAEIGAELEVVPLENWDFRPMHAPMPWTWTSPNLPTLESVALYPGLVLLEGANLSEGRGTTMPFQLAGAPYIPSSVEYAARLRRYFPSEAVVIRPMDFLPTFNKWKGQVCHGAQFHVVRPEVEFPSFALGLCVLKVAMELAGEAVQGKLPPYEYEYVHPPLDLIVGLEDSQTKLATLPLDHPVWTQGHATYLEQVASALLYPRELQPLLLVSS